jgi:hypothetical protein
MLIIGGEKAASENEGIINAPRRHKKENRRAFRGKVTLSKNRIFQRNPFPACNRHPGNTEPLGSFNINRMIYRVTL